MHALQRSLVAAGLAGTLVACTPPGPEHTPLTPSFTTEAEPFTPEAQPPGEALESTDTPCVPFPNMQPGSNTDANAAACEQFFARPDIVLVDFTDNKQLVAAIALRATEIIETATDGIVKPDITTIVAPPAARESLITTIDGCIDRHSTTNSPATLAARGLTADAERSVVAAIVAPPACKDTNGFRAGGQYWFDHRTQKGNIELFGFNPDVATDLPGNIVRQHSGLLAHEALHAAGLQHEEEIVQQQADGVNAPIQVAFREQGALDLEAYLSDVRTVRFAYADGLGPTCPLMGAAECSSSPFTLPESMKRYLHWPQDYLSNASPRMPTIDNTQTHLTTDEASNWAIVPLASPIELPAYRKGGGTGMTHADSLTVEVFQSDLLPTGSSYYTELDLANASNGSSDYPNATARLGTLYYNSVIMKKQEVYTLKVGAQVITVILDAAGVTVSEQS